MTNQLERRAGRQAKARRFRLGDSMSAPEWITIREATELAGYHVNYIKRMKQLGADKFNLYSE